MRPLGPVWRDLTGMLRGSSGKFSQLRVTVAVFGTAFVVHWPTEWTSHAVAALAILVFATPVDALFARVPLTETLGAIQAFFSAVGTKAERAESYGWGGSYGARSPHTSSQWAEPSGSARATMPGDEP
jgi:hypothetical protein